MFESAKLKIERADHHIADLERQLADFTSRHFNESIRYSDDGQADITFITHAPAPSVSMTIGDAIHNLWTALDHMTWELVDILKGCQHHQLYFPKGGDCQSYKGTCHGMETSCPGIEAILQPLEICPGGRGECLYVLNLLDRTDKHSIFVPIIHAPGIDELVLISEGGKVRRILSELYGQAVRIREGETFTISGAPTGSKLAFKNNAKISPHILFGKIEFVEGKAILPTISQLRDAVADTISNIEFAIS